MLGRLGKLGSAAAVFGSAAGGGGVGYDHDPQRRLGVLLQDLSGPFVAPVLHSAAVVKCITCIDSDCVLIASHRNHGSFFAQPRLPPPGSLFFIAMSARFRAAALGVN
jgi:hypothetical protein